VVIGEDFWRSQQSVVWQDFEDAVIHGSCFFLDSALSSSSTGFVSFPILIGLAIVRPAAVPDPLEARSQMPRPGQCQSDKNRERDKSGGTAGKSRIEKETGTVNDRIFEVLPNYGTVENAKNLPPMTTGQKFRLATAGVFDWGSYPLTNSRRNRTGKE